MASKQMTPKVAKSIGMQPSLPLDIVVDMLSRLPVKSLVRFRCVCKQWSSLTYNPYFINKHRHRVPSSLSSFIYRRIEDNDTKPYDFVKDDAFATHSSYKIRINEYLLHFMSNIVHGLMCACGSDGHVDADLFLLNPFTREFAKLIPISKKSPWSGTFGFGYDVTTGKYKVVRLFFSSDRNHYCEILTLGSQEWRYLGKVPCWVPFLANVTFLDGTIYWEGDGMALLSFDVKQEKFAIILGPPDALEHHPDALEHHPRPDLLSALHCSAGHLFLGLQVYNCRYFKIWVMKDFATGLWINLYDIDATSSVIEEIRSGYLRILSIEDEKVLLVLTYWHRDDDCGKFIKAFVSYDTRSKAFRKLCDKDENCSWLNPCSESLISPGKLLEMLHLSNQTSSSG